MKAISAALVLLLLLTAASVTVGDVRLKYFRIEKENTAVVLNWEAELEVDVLEYEVLRRTPYTNGQFARVKTLPVHGAGRSYRVVDDQVYKDGLEEQVHYQLVAVFKDGVVKELGAESINYTSTAARRTWGSIKAMFQ